MGFSRINSFWWNFYRITKDEKILFDETYSYNPEPQVEKNPELYEEVREKRFNNGVRTIIFSALTLESLINDLAAINLGDSFFEKHLDKNTTLSKYLIVVKIISQKDFPRDSQAYECLDYLFKIRNKLVHPKSKSVPFKDGEVDFKEFLNRQEDYLKNWKKTVNKCFSALRLVSDVLIELIPEESMLLLFHKIVNE